MATPVQQRLIEAAEEIGRGEPSISYMHAVLCQVGLPRRRSAETTFERRSGNVSLRVRAGELWDAQAEAWIAQPVPYGTRPRLALIHISTRAVKTKNPEVEVGSSVRDLLLRLGLGTNGREYAGFQKQMAALAACEMRLGYGASTIQAQPIREFRAWHAGPEGQRDLWPASVVLTREFYESLLETAVPLDLTAVSALSHSALALDLYTWLSHRLCRIRSTTGDRVSWMSLREQFGQEFREVKDFRREVMDALITVTTVYPDARLQPVRGGLRLLPSRPPISKTVVSGRTVGKPAGE